MVYYFVVSKMQNQYSSISGTDDELVQTNTVVQSNSRKSMKIFVVLITLLVGTACIGTLAVISDKSTDESSSDLPGEPMILMQQKQHSAVHKSNDNSVLGAEAASSSDQLEEIQKQNQEKQQQQAQQQQQYSEHHSDENDNSDVMRNILHRVPSIKSQIIDPPAYEAPIPLPNSDPGLIYNASSTVRPQVKLEAFLDLNCPDSVAAWPVLKEVQQHYGNENVELVVHQFPLPYHRNAFLCTQGMALIRQELPSEVFAYMEGIFDNYIRFSTGLTRNRTEYNVIDSIADVAVQVTSIDRAKFVDEINNYTGDVVRAWKYACRRSVAGTPWYAINNVDLAINPSNRVTYEDWLALIDPLFEDDEAST